MQTVVSSEENRLGCFAVKVRSRAEATITDMLRRKGYEVLLPTYTHRRQYSDRVRMASCALFPGYVFVRLNPQELLGVISTQGVSYVVKSGSMLQPLPREEECLLESLAEFVEECEPCHSYQAGQRVQIMSGPLKNQQGTLVRMDGKERIVLSLNSIFSSITVNLRDTEVVCCDA